MIYISRHRNKSREITEERVNAFLDQFPEHRRSIMTGHILLTRDLIHYVSEQAKRPDTPPSQVNVVTRAASLITYLAEDLLDSIAEIYVGECDDPSPSLSESELLITGYRNGLEYIQDAMNSTAKRGTFKGRDKDIAMSFYTATGLELGERLVTLMEHSGDIGRYLAYEYGSAPTFGAGSEKTLA